MHAIRSFSLSAANSVTRWVQSDACVSEEDMPVSWYTKMTLETPPSSSEKERLAFEGEAMRVQIDMLYHENESLVERTNRYKRKAETLEHELKNIKARLGGGDEQSRDNKEVPCDGAEQPRADEKKPSKARSKSQPPVAVYL